nr:MAG TPA: hypothetical protein [Bacteriophage sp.]
MGQNNDRGGTDCMAAAIRVQLPAFHNSINN